MDTNFGMGRGRTYPASAARHLLNPLRHLVQPPRRVVDRMPLHPTDRVLEIGCGPGWFSPSIAARVPDPITCLHEVRRVLRLDGFVTVSETRRDSDFVPFVKLHGLALEAGLRLSETHGPRWEYVATLVSTDGRPSP